MTWRKPSLQTRPDQPDPSMRWVKFTQTMRLLTLKSEQAKRKIAHIEVLLRSAPMCLQDIASDVHMTVPWARMYINHLRTNGMVHISCYEERQNTYLTNVAMFKWGPGKDAEKPKLLPKQYVERHRDAIANDPDTHATHLARRRALSQKPKMDPLMAAFFGRVS